MYINRIGGAGGKNLVALRAAMKALGPSLLLDADLVSGNDGDAIQTWADDSGNSLNFSQGTTGYRPVLKKAANGINGHNVLRFDGADDYLSGPNLSTFIAAAADTYWVVFKVYNITTNDTGTIYYNDTALAGAYNWGIVFLTSSGAVAFIYDTSSTYKTVAKSISTSAPYIARARHSSGNLYFLVNGGSEGSVAAGDVASLSNAATLGVDNLITNFTQIDIAEVIVFNSALSSANMAIVDAYLKAKYATY